MESAVHPMVLGPVMIVFAVVWFSWIFWDGMRKDRTPLRPTRRPEPGEPGPWWTNEGFGAPEPIPVPVELDNTSR